MNVHPEMLGVTVSWDDVLESGPAFVTVNVNAIGEVPCVTEAGPLAVNERSMGPISLVPVADAQPPSAG